MLTEKRKKDNLKTYYLSHASPKHNTLSHGRPIAHVHRSPKTKTVKVSK